MTKLYQVVYDAETKITMTQQEVQNFITELSKGKEIVEFKGEFLTKFFRVIAKKETKEGRLHDGTKVTKVFGEWKDAQDPSLHLDANYYPEISEDKVLSEEEWQQQHKLLT